MKLYIKYMVSIRCKMVVKAELQKLGIEYSGIELGTVEVTSTINAEVLRELKKALAFSGLELMDDEKAVLIERIKSQVIEMVHYSNELPKVKNSVWLSQKLNYSYDYLAHIFSASAGITIEHYIILHKIERAKELLLYDELNLTEIAYKLNYSSVAHLSNQFKKVTGLTPSFFKKLKYKRLIPLERIGMM